MRPNKAFRPAWLQLLTVKLAGFGLNVSGIAPGEDFDEYLPGCRSVVVFASGGTLLWDCFVKDIRANPQHLTAYQHPFDEFVRRQLRQADPSPCVDRRWVRCAAEPEEFIDFRALAFAAGLGWKSLQGMLIHPRYGLWIGLRAALLTTQKISVEGPVVGESPCLPCAKPCIAACPGGAIDRNGWNVSNCAEFHQLSELCHGRCSSRLSCPQGEQFRHTSLQHHYHNARQSGRAQLAKELGIIDKVKGLDPPWSAWQKVNEDS